MVSFKLHALLHSSVTNHEERRSVRPVTLTTSEWGTAEENDSIDIKHVNMH